MIELDPLTALRTSYEQHTRKVEKAKTVFEAARERIRNTKPKDRKHIERLEQEEAEAYQAYEAALADAQDTRSAADNEAVCMDKAHKDRDKEASKP